MKDCFRFILLEIALCFLSFEVGAAGLSLEDYLEQVRATHQGFQAAQLKSQGATAQALEENLLYAPQFYSTYSFSDDKKQTSQPAVMGSETRAHLFETGISKLFSSGTQAKVFYNSSHYKLEGVNPASVPLHDYYETKPTLQFTQSLWRNFLGRETQATAEIMSASARATSLSEAFRMKQILLQAEIQFFRFYFSERALEIRKTTLAQAKELRDWASRRTKLELADKSDFFQADANFQLRSLELERAEQDLRNAIRDFNSLRGRAEENFEDQLQGPDEKAMEALELPTRAQHREDTLALEQKAKIEEASAAALEEKYRPSLNLQASLSGNGRDAAASDALSDSFKKSHPTYAIGIHFSMPLYFLNAEDVKAGARKQALGSKTDWQRKAFEEDRSFEALSQKFSDLKRELKLAIEIERLQKIKSANESARLKKGRTTTFQVVQFEQDMNIAALSRIQIASELLMTFAELKTYR